MPGMLSSDALSPSQEAARTGGQQGQTATKGGNKTLWVGDLQYWMDEAFLTSTFVGLSSEVVSVKVIRNRASWQNEGYGFVEFKSSGEADRVLRTYAGQPFPGSDQSFRLNWAAFGVGKNGCFDDYSVFVGDLALDVTDFQLQERFRELFPSVRSAKIIIDVATGRSKGYGFVRFGDETERDRALEEMQGTLLSSRAIRVSQATVRKPGSNVGLAMPGDLSAIVSQISTANGTPYGSASSSGTNLSDYEPPQANTTLFVGGLAPEATETDLAEAFGKHGTIVYTKIPQNKGCGFVQFENRQCAEKAKSKLNGKTIRGAPIRISWGHKHSKTFGTHTAIQQYSTNPHSYFPNMGYYDHGMAMYYDPYSAYCAAMGAGAHAVPGGGSMYPPTMQLAYSGRGGMPVPMLGGPIPHATPQAVLPHPPPPPPQAHPQGMPKHQPALDPEDLKRFTNMMSDSHEAAGSPPHLALGQMQQVQ
mmetsp:Transcript_13132/g.33949  ORF Transcript_13132/g.33949 Transcript_13132/m.33949 type:complete len:475 (+) Transcript_13132:171-1595(+)